MRWAVLGVISQGGLRAIYSVNGLLLEPDLEKLLTLVVISKVVWPAGWGVVGRT